MLAPFRIEPVAMGREHVFQPLARDLAFERDVGPLASGRFDAPDVLAVRRRGRTDDVEVTVVAALAEEVAAGAGIVSSPAVLLAGGECTVTVTDEPGKGGPNQEFVLSAGLGLQEEAVVAAIDADGEDGSSEYAGAILESGAIEETERASAHLGSNDAGSYLEAAGATILTGPTGTNVNDIIVVVIPE